jgi:hypothetical protein
MSVGESLNHHGVNERARKMYKRETAGFVFFTCVVAQTEKKEEIKTKEEGEERKKKGKKIDRPLLIAVCENFSLSGTTRCAAVERNSRRHSVFFFCSFQKASKRSSAEGGRPIARGWGIRPCIAAVGPVTKSKSGGRDGGGGGNAADPSTSCTSCITFDRARAASTIASESMLVCERRPLPLPLPPAPRDA